MPGVYGWYFTDLPPGVPDGNYHQMHGAYLLYVGISPKAPPLNGKPPSRQSIRSRVAYHYRGNAEGSTLRLTLGCLLSDELGIQLRRVGSGTRFTFADGERLIDQWMARSAYVTWQEDQQPWIAESALIAELNLPLNLSQNTNGAFRDQLSQRRREARSLAKVLPIAETAAR